MTAANMDDIAEVFKKLKFRRTFFGWVSEKDVWRKLEQVQKEYRSAYECQAAAYEARIKDRDDRIRQLQGGAQQDEGDGE